jgi:hypothetical protein
MGTWLLAGYSLSAPSMYAHIFLFCFILGNHFYLGSKVSFPMLMVGGVNLLLEPSNAADNLQVTGNISGTSKLDIIE